VKRIHRHFDPLYSWKRAAFENSARQQEKIVQSLWKTGLVLHLLNHFPHTREPAMTNEAGEITRLLRRWQSGDRSVEPDLFEMLLPELRRIAIRCFRGERPGHTLQPTALMNEAFLRLANAKGIDLQDRGHFLAIAARVMRRYLIDYARKRPGVDFVPMEGLPEGVLAKRSNLEMAVAVDALLDQLAEISPQRRAVVELKFFLGLNDNEAAEALNLSLHTLQREWYRARSWLFDRLNTESWKASPSTTSA
jgi:RNA polymerase sigma factor (TIGR02999 family)